MPLVKAIWAAAASGLALAAAAGIAAGLAVKRRRAGRNGDETALLEGIARHAALYDGLYEGVYQAARGEGLPGRDAIREFCERTARLEEDGAFAQAFAARFAGSADAEPDVYRREMEELLELFRRAGITRAGETELVLSPQVRREYIFLGEPVPDDGAVCRVLKPCWRSRERLIEQGMLLAKEAGE